MGDAGEVREGESPVVLTDILPAERADVAPAAAIETKEAALQRLSELLAIPPTTMRTTAGDFFRVLCERESLQSTGIGDGVAIPHGSLDGLEAQRAALLVCPDGLPFDAIDGRPVRILFAVVGPKRTTGEHLKTLARVSRLLRDPSFRQKLLAAREGSQAWELVREAESDRVV